ncbi:hypothetical protein [Apilactobacillus timberlakei]|uniref:hypothetical protein n=1 Tax=Apilactobacillus timberlakei TaxID=2008380 RepID=UPI00112D868E|nr:hypothetical protein [Apilactobacillus timberlakei]TPR21504.1 hypothetical protein DY083_05655 [Apilactobacillus timberlakei]
MKANIIYALSLYKNKRKRYSLDTKHIFKFKDDFEESYPKRSQIIKCNKNFNESKEYVVIGSKTVSAKQSKLDKYTKVKNKRQIFIMDKYLINAYSKFMKKYKLNFKLKPLIEVSGYIIRSKKDQNILSDKPYSFKVMNDTKNMEYLEPGKIGEVITKFGILKMIITNIKYSKNDENRKIIETRRPIIKIRQKTQQDLLDIALGKKSNLRSEYKN